MMQKFRFKYRLPSFPEEVSGYIVMVIEAPNEQDALALFDAYIQLGEDAELIVEPIN